VAERFVIASAKAITAGVDVVVVEVLVVVRAAEHPHKPLIVTHKTLVTKQRLKNDKEYERCNE
jgi:hypothetical protein